MKWRFVRQRALVLGSIVSVLVFAMNPFAYAAQSNSTNYQVNEVFMGSGGELHSCGSQYCSKLSAGEIAVGHAAGNLFGAYGGFNTDRTPYLAFSVAGGTTDVGVLSPFGTATTTWTFAVKTYLASGYVVTLGSDSPVSESGHHLATNTTTASASTVGTEQFGINVVENRTNCTTPAPANFGADPVQVPDNTFSFGSAAAGYNTCGLFKYNKGDTIASSSRSSGQTDYTMSFIYNISNVTPDGLYKYDGTLVATSPY